MIKIENLCKIYQMESHEVKAVDNINLNIKDGTFVIILGNSGSGKSTLLHMIGALDNPTSGMISVNGQKLHKMSRKESAHYRNRTLGFVFQSFYLESKYTAYENVELPLIQQKLSKQDRVKKITDALNKVGLAERILHKASELSGGEQQRVAIARAIVNNPDIILADEPTGNLDTKTGEDIMNLLKGLCRQGKTVVLVTHNVEQVKYADMIIKIKDGKIDRLEKRESGQYD